MIILRNYVTTRPTPDDWSPTFEDGTVEIHMQARKWAPENPTWCQISIWGGDDFYLVKRFDSEESMLREFNRIPLIIFQSDLLNKGFIPCD